MSRASDEVCIVIPHYREDLTSTEQSSLERCMSVLANYPKALVKPRGITCRRLLDEYPALLEESFADEYFAGVSGYNRLMLSDDFYARFERFEYILIYQLDAFVFSDQLSSWCRRGYDYVGAPWLPYGLPPAKLKHRLSQAFHRELFRLRDEPNPQRDGLHELQYEYRVGNGGLSLRRVRRLREVLVRLAARVERYRELDHYTFNEDVFFGVEVNRYWPNLRIPGWRTALGFSWETQPASAFQHCGGVLPFGCHAWNKWFPEDWRRIFAKAGLSLDQLL